MRDGFSEREIVYRAEDLILRLRDVRSCRIITDETGAITEIHVVASSERPPKMIARDVETALKAELDLEIDYRKIGVVMIDPDAGGAKTERRPEESGRPFFDFKDPPFTGDDELEELVDERLAEEPEPTGEKAPAPGPSRGPSGMKREVPPAAPPEMPEPIPFPAKTVGEEEGGGPGLEMLEETVRIEFVGFSVSMEAASVNAEVRLSSGGVEVMGSFEAAPGGCPVVDAVAQAAVRALMELLDEDFYLCLSGIREMELSGRKALIAVVDMVKDRCSSSYSGCAFVGRDAGEAAVMAVLDAVNRPFGRWKSIREIHYRIR